MNANFALLGLGMPEVFIILAVILIFFGAKKLPELAKGLGQGIKEFKKSSREITEDLQRSVEDEPPAAPRKFVEAKPIEETSDITKQPPTA